MFDWAKKLIADQAEGILRHVLTGLGGAMVSEGIMSSSQETQIIGGIVAAAGVAWSLYQKHAAATLSAAQASQSFHQGVTVGTTSMDPRRSSQLQELAAAALQPGLPGLETLKSNPAPELKGLY